MGASTPSTSARSLRGMEQGRFTGLRIAAGEKTPFSELAGTFTITNGIADNQDLRLVSTNLRVTGAGSFNLPARSLDYTVRPKIANLNATTERAVINLSNVEIPVRIEGPWEKPNFSVAGQEQILEAIKQIGKNLKSQGGRGRDQRAARWRRRSAEGQAARHPGEAFQEAVASPECVGAPVRQPRSRKFSSQPRFPLARGGNWPHMTRSVRPAVHPDPRGGGLSVYWLGRGPMAYTDSLFQLGMDLTRSSTAQKEDHGQSAHVRTTTGKTTSSSGMGIATPAPISSSTCSAPSGLTISSTSKRR